MPVNAMFEVRKDRDRNRTRGLPTSCSRHGSFYPWTCRTKGPRTSPCWTRSMRVLLRGARKLRQHCKRVVLHRPCVADTFLILALHMNKRSSAGLLAIVSSHSHSLVHNKPGYPQCHLYLPLLAMPLWMAWSFFPSKRKRLEQKW